MGKDKRKGKKNGNEESERDMRVCSINKKPRVQENNDNTPGCFCLMGAI